MTFSTPMNVRDLLKSPKTEKKQDSGGNKSAINVLIRLSSVSPESLKKLWTVLGGNYRLLVRKVGRMNNPGLSEMENTTSTPANPKKRKRPSIYDVCTPIVMKKQRTTPPVVSTLVIYPFSIPFLLLNNDLE